MGDALVKKLHSRRLLEAQGVRYLDEIVVSAGQRGMDVRLPVPDLVHVTGATFVEATTPPV